VAREVGARAHALPELHGLLEQEAEDPARQAERLRLGVGRAHLREDLVLAQHEGIERGRDAEEVPRRAAAGVQEEARPELARAVEAERICQRAAVLPRRRVPVLAREHELDPVAGRDQHRLRRPQPIRERLGRRLLERGEPALHALQSLDVRLVEGRARRRRRRVPSDQSLGEESAVGVS
jgi:hypothetical protein